MLIYLQIIEIVDFSSFWYYWAGYLHVHERNQHLKIPNIILLTPPPLLAQPECHRSAYTGESYQGKVFPECIIFHSTGFYEQTQIQYDHVRVFNCTRNQDLLHIKLFDMCGTYTVCWIKHTWPLYFLVQQNFDSQCLVIKQVGISDFGLVILRSHMSKQRL